MKIKTINLLLICSFLLFATNSFAQNPITMRSNAMGGVGVAFQDINAMFSNQAGIVHLDQFSAGIHTERRFQLTDLNTFTLGLALPTNAGVFGLSINYFGFDAFNQQKYGLVYARNLTSKFSIGGEINFHNFQILEYGSTNTLSFELGIQYEIGNNIIVGAKIANPIERDLANGEHLPTQFNLGMSYLPSDKVTLSLEWEQELDFNPNIKGGLEYLLGKVLFVRAGFATNPSLLSFGIGLEFNNFKIDTGTSFHQQLGWSPGLSFIYQPQKSSKK